LVKLTGLEVGTGGRAFGAGRELDDEDCVKGSYEYADFDAVSGGFDVAEKGNKGVLNCGRISIAGEGNVNVTGPPRFDREKLLVAEGED
jgi:hypothetical protein